MAGARPAKGAPEGGARIPGLAELARLWGVQPFYYDFGNQRRSASAEAMLALLRALGAPVAGPGDVQDALRERRDASWRDHCEPIHLAWDGRALPLELRLPAPHADARVRCTLTLEDGDARVWDVRLGDLAVEAEHEAGSERFLAKKLPLPAPLPPGYHRLHLEGPGLEAGTLVISAPRRAYGPETQEWGVFLPLYALRSRRSLGIGDVSDLAELARWVGALGGSAVGTLPLFAALLDEPLDPSPYAPASRLFWNELYLDLERAPGADASPAAQELLRSQAFRRAARGEVRADQVDYRKVASLKRSALERLAADFDPASADFRRFAESRPRLEEYARFRALTRARGESWPSWPAAARDGRIRPRDVDPAEVRYHLYAQWAMDRQLGALAQLGRGEGADPVRRRGTAAFDTATRGHGDTANPAGAADPANPSRTASPRRRVAASEGGDDPPRAAGLYLDIPLGVSRDGYDVWASRDLFPDGISAGAPPDALFGGGQDWGFPPMHPETLRRTGYRYFVDSLRTVMPFAGALRFDHVMSLHRLYWIPQGLGAQQGTYVRYHAEEFYAILALESHRHRTRVVGEDLGTVPQEVRAQMGRHHLGRMYVLQYEANPTKKPPVGAVIPGSVASLNTHDMPTFTAFWDGADIDDRVDLGLIDQKAAQKERREREKLKNGLASFLTAEGWLVDDKPDRAGVLAAALEFLASSDAWLTLAGLEDLWGEERPQNVPGTSEERPNWRRRARLSLEGMQQDPRIEGLLRTIDRIRRDSRDDNG